MDNKDNKDKDISELFVGEIMAMIGQAVVEYENDLPRYFHRTVRADVVLNS